MTNRCKSEDEMARARSRDTSLFPVGLPEACWETFHAAGYANPVMGIIYRHHPRPLSGVPLGGLDTSFVDLETSGMFGYTSMFNHLVPMGGPINMPFLGISVGGKTWALTTGQRKTHEYLWVLNNYSMERFAERHGTTISNVALAWLLQSGTCDVVLLGARNQEQHASNMGVLNMRLSEEEMQELMDVSELPAPYPMNFWNAFCYRDSKHYGGQR